MKLKLTGTYLLVELDQNSTTAGGIVIAGRDDHYAFRTGTIVLTGPGEKNDSGEFVPVPFAVGQRVLMQANGKTDVEHEGKGLKLICESDIIATIED